MICTSLNSTEVKRGETKDLGIYVLWSDQEDGWGEGGKHCKKQGKIRSKRRKYMNLIMLYEIFPFENTSNMTCYLE